MKRIFTVLSVLILISGCAALKPSKPLSPDDYMKLAEQTLDSKITALSALTDSDGEDILYIVDDPSGTPASKKITVTNLFTHIPNITMDTGGTFTLGATQWDDGSDAIDGEQIAADTIDDDSIDFSDVTCVDLTTSDCGAIVSSGNITSGDSFIIGSADIEEAELEILDGATTTTAQLNYINTLTEAVDDLLDLENGITGIVIGSGDGGGYAAATEGVDYLDINRIDDTKGNGDTTFVWSADKVYDEIAAASGDVSGPGGGSTDNALARWDGAGGDTLQDSGIIVDDSDNITGVASIEVDASATPYMTFNDSGNPGSDKEIGRMGANFLSGADGAEDGEAMIESMLAGSEVQVFHWSSDTESVTLGDSANGEDLIFDFEETTDNQVGIKTNSGVTEIYTTIQVSSGVKTVVDADGGDPDAYCYGGVWYASGAGTITLPAVAAGMQLTVENHTDGDVTIDPDGSEQFKLNGGTALTAGYMIIGTDAGDGCVLTYYSAGVWSAFCSGYEDNGS